MKDEEEILGLVARIRALAQTGLIYNKEGYDNERYQEIVEIANRITSEFTGRKLSEIELYFPDEEDYITPKVDIRAIIFNKQGKILLVKESVDGKWALPGGWGDVGFSPSEVAVKEAKEETGFDVEAVRILAIHDKKKHPHPPALHYVYRIYILCRIIGEASGISFDILDKGFFGLDNIPPLSEDRTLKSQIELMFDYYNNPDKEVEFD